MRASTDSTLRRREWASRMRELWSFDADDEDDTLIPEDEAAWFLCVDGPTFARVRCALDRVDCDGLIYFRVSDLRAFTARVLKIYPFGAFPANDGGYWWQ